MLEGVRERARLLVAFRGPHIRVGEDGRGLSLRIVAASRSLLGEDVVGPFFAAVVSFGGAHRKSLPISTAGATGKVGSASTGSGPTTGGRPGPLLLLTP
jgi:hypothetical protein